MSRSNIKTGLTTLSGVQATAQGTTTALNGAAGAASGLSAALGSIGLVISGISIVTGIINTISAAIHKARQEAIDAGEEAKDQINEINELYNQYESLKEVTNRTAEQDKAYKDIQEQLTELLVERAIKLKNLTVGTEEYAKTRRLDNETKEMEKRRDRDLKRLEEEQSAKLKALEDEKDAAIRLADEKWKEIQKVFNDSNLALIAAAGQFAPALYEQFHNLFTSRFELDLQELASLMEQLETKKSTFAAQSGVKPTTKAADTSLITTIPSFINKKNMAAAATGGKTLSDGIAMLHKDELVVNAPVTKMLEDILTKISPITKLDAMAIQGNIARYWGEKSIQGYRERATNIRNSYQNSTNNDSSTSVINNFNAPLQHIERVEGGADMEAAVNALERDIMRKISTML